MAEDPPRQAGFGEPRGGAPMGQAERNKELVDRALAVGFTGRDMSAVAEFLRRASASSGSSATERMGYTTRSINSRSGVPRNP